MFLSKAKNLHVSIRTRTNCVTCFKNLSTSANLNSTQSEVLNKEASGKKEYPKLVEVPTLPFLGSFLTQYSGTPPFDPSNVNKFQAEMRKRFGEFFSFGIPGFGQGINGTIYSISDPNEMMKIVRNEGAYPSGVVERLWPIKKAMKSRNWSMVQGDDYGLLGQGERWKKHRTFLQNGMLHPKAAHGFIPGIVSAAELASQGAPLHKENFTRFLNSAAFDMFCTFMFGELTKCAASNEITPENEENYKFSEAAIQAMEMDADMLRSPYQNLLMKMGIDSADFKKFMVVWDTVYEIGMKKIKNFYDRYQRDELTVSEKSCYLAGAIKRFEDGESDLTLEEVLELCLFGLWAAVDTTSSFTGWNIMHLALNPDAQEKLHDELKEAMKKTGDDKLSADIFKRENTPFLHSVLKETNRLTAPFASVLTKTSDQSDIEIYGVKLPKGTVFQLEHIGTDKKYFEDADTFRPERWSVEEAKKRKDTDKEILDHPAFRDSFSQGARRCPASRVATNEVMALVSQLVLDYKISAPYSTLDDVPTESRPVFQAKNPILQFTPRV